MKLPEDWSLPADIRQDIAEWYGNRAQAVDCTEAPAQDGLVYAAERGFLSLGVPESLGGAGGSLTEMAEAIASVARECLTSAFVLWCHRMFIAYVSRSGQPFLLEEALPQVLRVERFGATGLANAMKHAAALEELKVAGRFEGGRIVLNGGIPWASNLVGRRFVVAIAAKMGEDRASFIAVPGESPGLEAGQAYSLVGMTGTVSSSLQFNDVAVGPEWVIADDADAFLPSIRPTFLVLQSGLAWGLAAAALGSVQTRLSGPRAALRPHAEGLAQRLCDLVGEVRRLSKLERWGKAELYAGLKARMALAELAVEAAWVELEAAGGGGYLASSHTARRLREAAFLPVQSPSLVQLRLELERLREEAV